MHRPVSRIPHLPCHLILPLFAVFLWMATGGAASATTWWVQQSAAAGGTGTQASPFQTIGAAVAHAQTSDTITVADGTYNEAVNLTKGGTTTAPFTLEATYGQHPVVSGFTQIPTAAWSLYSGTAGDYHAIYTATVGSTAAPWNVRDLYGRLTPISVAKTNPVLISTLTTSGTTYTVTFPSQHLTFDSVRSSFVWINEQHTSNNYFTYYITGLTDNGTTCTVTFTGDANAPLITAGVDTIQICNHPSLTTAGSWSYQNIGNGQTTLWWGSGGTGALSMAYTRTVGDILRIKNLSNIVVSNLIFEGAVQTGIVCANDTNITIQSCTAVDNGIGYTVGGAGIGFDTCTNVTVKNCVLTSNLNGFGATSVVGLTMSQCLVCYDWVDGIDFGSRAGSPSSNVKVDHCYVHHHMGVGHADNIQFDLNETDGVLIDSNALAFSGQSVIATGVTGGVLSNNLITNSLANSVIGTGWTAINNTFEFGAIGAFNAPGSLENNVFYFSGLGYQSGVTASDYNLFWADSATNHDPVAYTTPYHAYTSSQLPALTTATGYEADSTGENPLFMNAPIAGGTANANSEGATTIYVGRFSSNHMYGYFSVGDIIEINGDGVPRTVTASTVVPGGYGVNITFTPGDGLIWRTAMVWDWPAGTTNLNLDLRPQSTSPALHGSSSGGQRGSTVDITAYAQGKFDGTGTVNLPQISGDITNIWTHNSNYPYTGIYPQ